MKTRKPPTYTAPRALYLVMYLFIYVEILSTRGGSGRALHLWGSIFQNHDLLVELLMKSGRKTRGFASKFNKNSHVNFHKKITNLLSPQNNDDIVLF